MEDLHRTLEIVERAEMASYHAASAPAARRVLGLRTKTVDGALVSVSTGDPSILWNRALGLGVDKPLGTDTISTIATTFRDAGIGNYFLQIDRDLVTPGVEAQLDRAGLRRHRAWMKFARGIEDTPDPHSDLRVEKIGPEWGEAFGRIVAAGFDLSDASVPLLAAMTEAPGWHLFMSFDGDQPAGTGALFVHEGVGWFDCAATAPAFRRRGAQRAVLAARVTAARELGCHTLGTCTGEAVEGDPQHSYHNIQWAGFKEAFARDNFVPKG